MSNLILANPEYEDFDTTAGNLATTLTATIGKMYITKNSGSGGNILTITYGSNTIILQDGYSFKTEFDGTNWTNKSSFDEIEVDTSTFTSIPTLPASDPTTDNQATRKKYVDDNIGGATNTVYTITTGTDDVHALPTAVGVLSDHVIKRQGTGTGKVTFTTVSGQTIDGLAPTAYTLDNNSAIIVLFASGGNWFIKEYENTKQQCKVWCNLKGTVTTSIRNSFNVSSFVRDLAGTYTVNFTSNFTSADFSVGYTAGNVGSTEEAFLIPQEYNVAYYKFTLENRDSTLVDRDTINLQIFGT